MIVAAYFFGPPCARLPHFSAAGHLRFWRVLRVLRRHSQLHRLRLGHLLEVGEPTHVGAAVQRWRRHLRGGAVQDRSTMRGVVQEAAVTTRGGGVALLAEDGERFAGVNGAPGRPGGRHVHARGRASGTTQGEGRWRRRRTQRHHLVTRQVAHLAVRALPRRAHRILARVEII